MSVGCTYDAGCVGWRVEPDRTRVWVRVWGELDISGADDLRRTFDDLRASGWRHIGVDLTRLRFIDIAGIRVLFEEAAHAHRSDRTLIVLPSPCYERLLALIQATGTTVIAPTPARRPPGAHRPPQPDPSQRQ